ncbi:MAG: CBS domain-containing protein [Planctomycetota bacterium]|nr:MAG: CBS domain-containing protein [Planctomycetota bacterium]
MTTLRDLLGEHPKIVHVTPDVTVRAAAKAMAGDNVGCVVILEQGRLMGLFTERDILKRVLLKDLNTDEVRVEQVMTRQIITGRAEQTADEGREIVRSHHIRHLPVVAVDGGLLGVLSLRDLLQDEAEEARRTVEEVHRFLHGEVFEGPR